MKNFFKRFKTYGFWVSLSSAIILFLTAFGHAFGFTVENQVVEDCIMSIAGILVVLGIVSMGNNSKKDDENSDDDQGDFEDELDDLDKNDMNK